MPNLTHQISQLAKSGDITSAGEQFCVANLMDKAAQIRLQFPYLKHNTVAIHYVNLADFIVALLAFDGWCETLYLCPPNVSKPNDQDIINWPLTNEVIITKTADCSVTQTNWFLATSGTTGEPKWFSHNFKSLTASTKCSENLQALCWALLYQPFRFAGLQVLLQALLSGADLLDVSEQPPVVQVALMQQHKVTAVSATPSLWRQLLMTGQASELTLSHITLGGEIADQAILDKLRRLYPHATLRQIYASTEAGVGIVVADGQAGFPIEWLNDESRDVVLKVSQQQHLMLKPKHQLCASLIKQTDPQGFVDTSDKVEIKDGRVIFIGRATGTINVGGNKVHPEKVEQVILQCPDVSQASVYAKTSPVMGQLVVADICLVDGLPGSLSDKAAQKRVKLHVLTICKTQLQRFEIPTKISIVEHIANDPSGKLNRKQQHD